jgi:DNA-binding transcriptional ArsR family regulator
MARELVMFDNTALARIGALVGDPGRASMLAALLDGRALTAMELAAHGGVTPQTASGHLAKLVATGLVVMRRQGRHRYHALASSEVAGMLESMSGLAASLVGANGGRPVRVGPRDAALRAARTCYDHLAGRLAVGLADAMSRRGHVEIGRDGGLVTREGAAFLLDFGIDLPAATPSRRALCRFLPGLDRAPPSPGGRPGRRDPAPLLRVALGPAHRGHTRTGRDHERGSRVPEGVRTHYPFRNEWSLGPRVEWDLHPCTMGHRHMADEEPKGPPLLFASLDRESDSTAGGTSDEPELDPVQRLQAAWHLLRLLLAVSALGVGVFMSSCGTFLAVSQFAQTPLGPNSRSAPGVIVGHKRSGSGTRRSLYVYAPVVRFTADGREFEITSRLSTNTPAPVGQRVQVRFEAGAPERAVLVGWAEWGLSVEWMAGGSLLFAAGILMWRKTRATFGGRAAS